MDPQSPGSSGLLGSIRGFADGAIGSVQDRLELFALEVQEEKHRLIRVLLWCAALVVLGLLFLVSASFAVVVLFWDTARVAVVVGLTLAYGIGFGAAAVAFRRYLRRQPLPFAATLQELQEDRACVKRGN